MKQKDILEKLYDYQKDAVVAEVKNQLPNFVPYKDNAILLLSGTQLDIIKTNIYSGIVNGLIEYSKSVANVTEVRAYARSMVMNHLKKAKELNGGCAYKAGNTNSTVSANASNIPISRPVRTKVKIAPKGVNPDLLTAELQEYVRTLV
jgi:hypothetical protein